MYVYISYNNVPLKLYTIHILCGEITCNHTILKAMGIVMANTTINAMKKIIRAARRG